MALQQLQLQEMGGDLMSPKSNQFTQYNITQVFSPANIFMNNPNMDEKSNN